jgi:hypothetical protein
MVLKRNLVSFITVGIFIFALILSIVLFSVSLAKNIRIKADVYSKCGSIDRFVEESKMPLTEKSVAFLNNEQDRLKNLYSRFKLAFSSPLQEEIPEEDLEPLRFKEKLIQAQKKLRYEAEQNNLLLPQSMGFAKYETELSEPSEIPDLLKRLKVIEELIQSMANSGIGSLDEINFAEREIKGESPKSGAKTTDVEEADIYYDIPISFKIECTSLELMDFLNGLESSPIIFIVDDLDIESGNNEAGNIVKASLSLKAIALN